MGIGIGKGNIRTPTPIGRAGTAKAAAERDPAIEQVNVQLKPEVPTEQRQEVDPGVQAGSRTVNRAAEDHLRARLEQATAARDATVAQAHEDGVVTRAEKTDIHRAEQDVAHANLDLRQDKFVNTVVDAVSDFRITRPEVSKIVDEGARLNLARKETELADAKVQLDDVRRNAGGHVSRAERREIRAAQTRVNTLQAVVDQLRATVPEERKPVDQPTALASNGNSNANVSVNGAVDLEPPVHFAERTLAKAATIGIRLPKGPSRTGA